MIHITANEYSRVASHISTVQYSTDVQIMDDLMDEEIASIWLKLSRRGMRKVHLGAIYREQTLLRRPKPNNSADPDKQTARWQKLIQQWKKTSHRADCFVVGDTNLDINK